MTRLQNTIKLIFFRALSMGCKAEMTLNYRAARAWRSAFLVGVIGLPIFAPEQAYAVAPMIAAGTKHTLALRSDGTFVAWGSGDSGQLGIAWPALSAALKKVSGTSNVRTIAGRGQPFACSEGQWDSMGMGRECHRAAKAQQMIAAGADQNRQISS